MESSTLTSTPQQTDHRSGVNSLSDYGLYLRSFFRSGLDVASLLPSSRWTARTMLAGLNFDRSKTVLELGAGTGAVTAELLSKARRRNRTIILERDPEFCARLKQRFPRAEILEEDALDLPHIIQKYEVGRVDHVISTLPLNWLSATAQNQLLRDICHALSPQGSFRQLTHLPWAHRSLLQRHFSSIQTSFTWRNFPPACSYVCRQPSR